PPRLDPRPALVPYTTLFRSECWQLALENTTGPTVLALSRQNLMPVRTSASSDNLCSHGGYELVASQGEAKVSLFASGSEVEIARSEEHTSELQSPYDLVCRL